MARATSGNGKLEEAMTALAQGQATLTQTLGTLTQAQATLTQNQATLVQTQAAFVARVSETDAQILQIRKEMAETNRINSERFGRIEALLLEHNRILQNLPDAIRDKIGFKTAEPR